MDFMDLCLPGSSVKKMKKTSGVDEVAGKEQDRITKLPDELLCLILSFLPIKLAAQTGILSKRWRYVWASVPVLDFDMHLRANFDGDMSAFDSFAKTQMERFTNFVDRLLEARGNLSIQKFRLACDQIDSKCLYNWICAMNGIEELDLEIGECGVWQWSPSLGKSLKVMKLAGDFSLDIPSTLSFPNLKFLSVDSVKYQDDQTIRKLLSCCSLLEDLHIKRTAWDNIRNFVISVPSLKRLTLHFQSREDLYNEEDEEVYECKLFVDAPNVEYLRLVDYMSDCIIVNCMPYVTESHVSAYKISEFDDMTEDQMRNYGSNVCALFRSIPNVKHLTIEDLTMESISWAFDRRLPVFHNLVHLEVDIEGVNGAILLPTLLELCPKLETLVLPQGTNGLFGLQGFSYEDSQIVDYRWKPPQNVPQCLLFSLKEVEIRQISGELEELKLLKYFLKNAMVLEKMTILCLEYEGHIIWEWDLAARTQGDGFSFIDDLMNYTRGSAACQLNIQIP